MPSAPLSGLTIFTISVSIASIILAMVAIVLSILFYRWAKAEGDKISKASEGIANSVSMMQDIFNRFYSDTFGIMKETVTDMRKHVLSGQSESVDAQSVKDILSKEMEGLIDEKFTNFVEELRARDSLGRERTDVLQDQIAGLKAEFAKAVEEVVEKREEVLEGVEEKIAYENVKGNVIRYLRDAKDPVELADLVEVLFDIPTRLNMGELFNKLKNDGILSFDHVEMPWSIVTIGPAVEFRTEDTEG